MRREREKKETQKERKRGDLNHLSQQPIEFSIVFLVLKLPPPPTVRYYWYWKLWWRLGDPSEATVFQASNCGPVSGSSRRPYSWKAVAWCLQRGWTWSKPWHRAAEAFLTMTMAPYVSTGWLHLEKWRISDLYNQQNIGFNHQNISDFMGFHTFLSWMAVSMEYPPISVAIWIGWWFTYG